MTLDDLYLAIPDHELELKNSLKKCILDWKVRSEDLDILAILVERWHGNVWFKSEQDSNDFYRNWISFKEEYIDRVGGMTMNERLYVFGLFPVWDHADENGKTEIYKKLKAKK